MPRSTPRATLKLPTRVAPASTADDLRAPARKPIRGGVKAPKQSLAQRAGRSATSTARPLPETDKADEKAVLPGPPPDATPRRKDDSISAGEREFPPLSAGTVGKPKETPRSRGERQTQAPKSYPKRGIARSTGARALPPTRLADHASTRLPPAKSRATAAQAPASGPSLAPRTAAADTVRRPLNEPPRLAKRISEMALCSRREADEWIENGWVSVDGVIVTTLGIRVHPNARIEIADEASKHTTESVTILLNKPQAMDAGNGESHGMDTLQLICAHNQWAEDETRRDFKATHLRGLAQAGKLDAETTGMLVYTQEGSVARRITGDDTRLEKEYMVRVEGELSPEGLKLLNHGLALDEVKLKRAQVSWQNEQQLRFVLHETRKQQIQRMCEQVGLRVIGIKRIRIGSVSLGKLPAGKWRYLRENERF